MNNKIFFGYKHQLNCILSLFKKEKPFQDIFTFVYSMQNFTFDIIWFQWLTFWTLGGGGDTTDLHIWK